MRILALLIICAVFSGCTTLSETIKKVVQSEPVETDFGCCLIVGRNKVGEDIVEFQVLLDENDPYYSLVCFEVDLGIEAPVINSTDNCLKVIKVVDGSRTYYKPKTLPLEAVRQLEDAILSLGGVDSTPP